jgi:asparagine synthase (glutamine-hydrolysing)
MLRNYLNTLCPPCPEFPESEDPFVNLWRSLPEFREIFRTLEKGLLVEEGLISAKWIRHQLGYPYLIPSSFRQLWALLCLEIWFRLYINKPITESDLEISVKDFLK